MWWERTVHHHGFSKRSTGLQNLMFRKYKIGIIATDNQSAVAFCNRGFGYPAAGHKVNVYINIRARPDRTGHPTNKKSRCRATLCLWWHILNSFLPKGDRI